MEHFDLETCKLLKRLGFPQGEHIGLWYQPNGQFVSLGIEGGSTVYYGVIPTWTGFRPIACPSWGAVLEWLCEQGYDYVLLIAPEPPRAVVVGCKKGAWEMAVGEHNTELEAVSTLIRVIAEKEGVKADTD